MVPPVLGRHVLEVLALVTLLIVVPIVVLAVIGGVVAWLEENAERDLEDLETAPGDGEGTVRESSDGTTGDPESNGSGDEAA
ncbi:hypothetical protein [Halovivax limisalsi]|uniref:hypothetical protein n=1 Tax=Halovivax limisalsi TaxID=1453760 RepID=UPI001FFC76B3|nr:hypothetical protein [Halovivax limisalsi]